MNFLNKMERKWGRYAIRNLSGVIIATYVIGYILEFFAPAIVQWLTLEPYYILHGQVWRLVTWVLIPPSGLDLFTIIMLFFYYSIGNALEQTWGKFRYNVYIFSGILFTILGAFILYAIIYFTMGVDNVVFTSANGISLFSTYYINMSIFLAFALSYPDMQVLLYFIIPIRMKWMGLLYGVFVLYSFIQSNWVGRVAILASLLNFILFFLSTRNLNRVNPKEIKRKQAYRREVHSAQKVTKHKCAICGRTELDGDDLEFRFCSKCDGNYEYCQDHLFTHEHVKKHD